MQKFGFVTFHPSVWQNLPQCARKVDVTAIPAFCYCYYYYRYHHHLFHYHCNYESDMHKLIAEFGFLLLP
jgi:hypothetical protein